MQAQVCADLLVVCLKAISLKRKQRSHEAYLNDSIWIYSDILLISRVQISLERHSDPICQTSTEIGYGRHVVLYIIRFDGTILIQIAINNQDRISRAGRVRFEYRNISIGLVLRPNDSHPVHIGCVIDIKVVIAISDGSIYRYLPSRERDQFTIDIGLHEDNEDKYFQH